MMRTLFSCFMGLFLLCWVGQVGASTPLDVTYQVTPNYGLIGDPISLFISVDTSPDMSLTAPISDDTVGDFNVLDFKETVTPLVSGQTVAWAYQLAIYKVGLSVIPTLDVTYAVGEVSGQFSLPSRQVLITSLLSSANMMAPLAALKRPISLPLPGFVWGLIVLGLCAVFGGGWGWWYWKKLPECRLAELEAKTKRSPYEIAIEKLGTLEQAPYLSDGDFRQYFDQLSDIMREYLTYVYGISVLEMTTEEILAAYQGVVHEQPLKRIKKVLVICDFAKFAKYAPSQEEQKETLDRVYDLLEKTKEAV